MSDSVRLRAEGVGVSRMSVDETSASYRHLVSELDSLRERHSSATEQLKQEQKQVAALQEEHLKQLRNAEQRHAEQLHRIAERAAQVETEMNDKLALNGAETQQARSQLQKLGDVDHQVLDSTLIKALSFSADATGAELNPQSIRESSLAEKVSCLCGVVRSVTSRNLELEAESQIKRAEHESARNSLLTDVKATKEAARRAEEFHKEAHKQVMLELKEAREEGDRHLATAEAHRVRSTAFTQQGKQIAALEGDLHSTQAELQATQAELFATRSQVEVAQSGLGLGLGLGLGNDPWSHVEMLRQREDP